MRKQLIRVLTMFGFLMAMTAATTFAQTKPTIKVNVPFDFGVSNRTLPAGEYTLSERGSGGGMVIVRNNATTKDAAYATAMPLTAKKEADKPMLVFHRYGNQYFLAQVIQAGTSRQELIQTRSERQVIKEQSSRHLAQADARPEIVTVIATQQ